MEKSEKPIPRHFNDFLDYLDVEKGLSSTSQATYGRLLKKFFDWLEKNKLSGIKPDELNDQIIWQYRVYLSRSLSRQDKQLKKNTQNHYLIALRNLLAFFANRDILCLPPEKIKLAKHAKEISVKFLTLDQVRSLLAAPNVETITGLRDRAILETFFSTGMRVAELTALNRDQIRLGSPLLKDLEIGIVGKGNRPRTVYFSQRALEWLKKYLDKREDKEKALFINYKGPKDAPRRLTPRSIETLVKKYSKLAGIPLSTVPHTLRHSFATDLLAKGVDLRAVQEFLGHRNISTTQIYTHVVSKQLRDIHRRFHSGEELKE
ncbi:MAG: tyrosine-type recombinase/integrase [Candidatus Pacebacteria bacterium]|nr:tyrosine-type recombinase/integrase [Candidatus Paceibacterota bacterium]